MTLGFDIVGEGEMDELVTAMKPKCKTRGDVKTGGEVKVAIEDLEASPVWEQDSSGKKTRYEASSINASKLVYHLLRVAMNRAA